MSAILSTRPADIFRSTAVRLSAVFAGLCLAAFLIASAATYVLVVEELEERADRRLAEVRRALVDSFERNGLADLVAEVERQVRAASGNGPVYLLNAPDGRRLAGNLPASTHIEKAKTVPATDLGIDSDERFRLSAGDIGGMYLVVGSSLEEVEEVGEILLAALGWGTLGMTAFALGGGLLLGIRTQRRISGIALALDEAAAGDLDARVPLRNSGDDLDQVATRMNEALERVQQVLESLRQVSADIAHDLKTPIGRLQITIQQARDAAAAGQTIAPLLDEAEHETGTINATFEALLRIAQIESGRRRERFDRLALPEILTTLADAYGAVAEDAGHELVVHIPDENLAIEGDRELLFQMFANLIENAIRHCPNGARIELTTDGGSAGSIVVRVSDNGPGIPAGEREKVFRRLYRLDKSRTTPGSGLGLSIVKAIADLHHASIELGDNNPGLVATIKFPAAAFLG